MKKIDAFTNQYINDNLPKFLSNIKAFEKAASSLDESDIKALKEDYYGLLGRDISDVFSEDGFVHVLTQKGINAYNSIIGGYTNSDGSKVKGINEYINLHNQQHKDNKLPKFKLLFKQILSDRESVA